MMKKIVQMVDLSICSSKEKLETYLGFIAIADTYRF